MLHHDSIPHLPLLALLCLASACAEDMGPLFSYSEVGEAGGVSGSVAGGVSGSVAGGVSGAASTGGAGAAPGEGTAPGPSSAASGGESREPELAPGALLGSAEGAPSPSEASDPQTLDPVPSAGCASETRSGSGRSRVTVGDDDRDYELVLPETLPFAAPLLIALHGYGMTPGSMASMTGLSELAEREGFVIAYPQAAGAPASWNAGGCCASEDDARADLDFIATLIDRLEAELCLDRTRVYVAGFSNGGMLAYRLACTLAERVAAVASVSGPIAISLDACNPTRPVPLLHVHGTDDPIIPYDGGAASRLITPFGEAAPTFPAVRDMMTQFARMNDCDGPTETSLRQLDSTCERHTGCTNGALVELCTIAGGGHTWPGGGRSGLAPRLVGTESQTLVISDVIWDFLARQRLPR